MVRLFFRSLLNIPSKVSMYSELICEIGFWPL